MGAPRAAALRSAVFGGGGGHQDNVDSKAPPLSPKGSAGSPVLSHQRALLGPALQDSTASAPYRTPLRAGPAGRPTPNRANRALAGAATPRHRRAPPRPSWPGPGPPFCPQASGPGKQARYRAAHHCLCFIMASMSGQFPSGGGWHDKTAGRHSTTRCPLN
jgi:hypothetical protein